MRGLLLAAAASLLAVSPAAAQTVILVRHAEKVGQSADSVLTAAGTARAEALAGVLSSAHLTNVLVSPAPRTRLTANPAALAAGLSPEVVAFDGGTAAHVARVAERVRALPDDAVVLVVGHSNTIPLIARALGETDAADMADCEHDRLTVIDLRGDAEPAAVFSRYGAASVCE